MNANKEYLNYISINPNVRFGKPCVAGTRLTVGDVLGYLASGMSADDVILDFPELSRETIHACLAFAAAREGNHLRIG